MHVIVCQFEGVDATPALPLAAGCLVSAAKADPELCAACTLDIEVVRGPIDEVVARFDQADVLGFSLYPWNTAYALAVAKAAKRARPGVCIVVGGPSVPRRPEQARAFLDMNAFVDLMAFAEGEATFCEILRARLHGTALDAVPGLAARGEPHLVTAPPGRMLGFDPTASPFLDGTFDDLYARHPGRFSMAVCETNRGCPFSCSFCDWSLTKKVVEYPLERVLAETAWVVDKGIGNMIFADANFGIRPRDSTILAHLAELKRTRGGPTSLYWYLTKNNHKRNLETIETLHEAGIATWVGLAVQDFDDAVLAAVKRSNIQTGESYALRRECAERGIPTVNELILALPGQTWQSFTHTIAEATPSFPRHDFVIFVCRLLENADLGSPESRAEFALETRRTRWLTSSPDFDPIVEEYQELVVGHRDMPITDFRKAFCFGFLVSALYNFRLLRVVLHHASDLAPHRDVLLALADAVARSDPGTVLHGISALLDRYVDSLLDAGPLVFPYDDARPGVRGAVDEAIARLALRHYDAFLEECRVALAPLVSGPSVEEAFRFQRLSIPQPGATNPILDHYAHDWPTYVALGGTGAPLDPTPTRVRYVPPLYAAIADPDAFATVHFGSIRSRLDTGVASRDDAPLRPTAPSPVAAPPVSG